MSDGVRTRMIKGRRYVVYEAADMANLARARAGIGAGVGQERSMFTPEEANRRVAFYAAQIGRDGQITR